MNTEQMQAEIARLERALAAAQEEARAAQSWLNIADALNKRMEVECAQRVQRWVITCAQIEAMAEDEQRQRPVTGVTKGEQQ